MDHGLNDKCAHDLDTHDCTGNADHNRNTPSVIHNHLREDTRVAILSSIRVLADGAKPTASAPHSVFIVIQIQ
eukprot:4502622-Lingulodinium_polyedra.AAC.1